MGWIQRHWIILAVLVFVGGPILEGIVAGICHALRETPCPPDPGWKQSKNDFVKERQKK